MGLFKKRSQVGAIDSLSLGILGFLLVSFLVGSFAVVRNNFDIRQRAQTYTCAQQCGSDSECLRACTAQQTTQPQPSSQARYKCNTTSGTCVRDDQNGSSRSLSECAESCKAPVITKLDNGNYCETGSECKSGYCGSGNKCLNPPGCPSRCGNGCYASDGNEDGEFDCLAYCNIDCEPGSSCVATSTGGTCKVNARLKTGDSCTPNGAFLCASDEECINGYCKKTSLDPLLKIIPSLQDPPTPILLENGATCGNPTTCWGVCAGNHYYKPPQRNDYVCGAEPIVGISTPLLSDGQPCGMPTACNCASNISHDPNPGNGRSDDYVCGSTPEVPETHEEVLPPTPSPENQGNVWEFLRAIFNPIITPVQRFITTISQLQTVQPVVPPQTVLIPPTQIEETPYVTTENEATPLSEDAECTTSGVTSDCAQRCSNGRHYPDPYDSTRQRWYCGSPTSNNEPCGLPSTCRCAEGKMHDPNPGNGRVDDYVCGTTPEIATETTAPIPNVQPVQPIQPVQPEQSTPPIIVEPLISPNQVIETITNFFTNAVTFFRNLNQLVISQNQTQTNQQTQTDQTVTPETPISPHDAVSNPAQPPNSLSKPANESAEETNEEAAVAPSETILGCPMGMNRWQISQCPFYPDNSRSHFGISAFDFTGQVVQETVNGEVVSRDLGNISGAPIYAAYSGYIVFYYNGFDQGTTTTDGSLSDGNTMAIESQNPETGETFYTIYSHLLDVSPQVITNCNNNYLCMSCTSAADCNMTDAQYWQCSHAATCPKKMRIRIEAGTLIGYVDDTGNSSAPHLHYEFVEEVSVGDITHGFIRKGNNNHDFSLPDSCVVVNPCD